jgi:zinc transport system substrate-binding protein
VQFNDHGHEPGEAEHFHIYFGNDSFDALMSSKTNPFFVKDALSVEGILDELMGHDHGEEKDEHVWLSLKNAKTLVGAIADALQELDPDNKDTYAANASAYIEKLSALDGAYQSAVDGAARKTVLFGDRFPFRYLVDDYGLRYYAAFAGCSAESEASFETVSFLAKKVDELGLPCVLTIEGKNHKLAETIVQSTAGKNQKVLTMDSMQSMTSKDAANGATYLSVMEQNLSVLKEALG